MATEDTWFRYTAPPVLAVFEVNITSVRDTCVSADAVSTAPEGTDESPNPSTFTFCNSKAKENPLLWSTDKSTKRRPCPKMVAFCIEEVPRITIITSLLKTASDKREKEPERGFKSNTPFPKFILQVVTEGLFQLLKSMQYDQAERKLHCGCSFPGTQKALLSTVSAADSKGVTVIDPPLTTGS